MHRFFGAVNGSLQGWDAKKIKPPSYQESRPFVGAACSKQVPSILKSALALIALCGSSQSLEPRSKRSSVV